MCKKQTRKNQFSSTTTPVHHLSQMPVENSIASRKRTALHHRQSGKSEEEAIKPAKRKKPSPTKMKQTSNKCKITSNTADNANEFSTVVKNSRSRNTANISLNEDSNSEVVKADVESTTGDKTEFDKLNINVSSPKSGKKKLNRVFSHEKAKKEVKHKNKGNKAETKCVEDLAIMMEKFWERVKRTGKIVGAHISMAGGIENSVTNSVYIGGTAFALFLKNQRRWDSPPYPEGTSDRFKNACEKAGFDPMKHVLPHGSYLINLCTADKEMRAKSYTSLLDDLQRCEMLGIGRYNLHPGSTKKECTEKEGIENLVDCLNRAISETKFVIIVIENMAGQGAVMGRTFEQLRAMLDGIKEKSRIGVCLDSCHLWAAGFDISSKDGYEKVMKDFGDIVGFQYLKGVHINDCKQGLGNKADRHENIGKGKIGLEAFRCLMNDPRLNDVPIVLETPNGDDESGKIWKEEIELLYSLVNGESAI